MSIFSITTPIYYVNDEPHLGHAYTTILADVLARYARLRGDETHFLTGVDEHGQKVFNAVRKAQITDAQAYVDQMAQRFQSTWTRLNISNDDFIRTTEARHTRVVQCVLKDLWERGEIYRGEYEGWYCVPDERFWTEKDLVEGNCPDCGRPVERITEANYFFRMSKYQDQLVETIKKDPNLIQPSHRRSEVLGFLRRPLADLCISRPASRLNWGIRLPFAPDYVTYVWFDALINYVSANGYLAEDAQKAAHFAEIWPNTIHLIGKDILTTHAVYWLTMLTAMNLPLPKSIFAHGWWLNSGQKMGKSLGNAVKPLDLVDVYGVDAFRYFVMRDMTPGQDADFNQERLAARYETDLANNLGNLLQRVTSMTARYLNRRLVEPEIAGEEEKALQTQWQSLPGSVFARVENFAVNEGLGEIMNLLTATNTYLERTAPWKEAKADHWERVETILSVAAQSLRVAANLLTPVIPVCGEEILRRLDLNQPITAGEPLFPRIG